MDFLRTSSFRPIPGPDIPLPFALRSVGHGRVGPGWKDNPIRKNFIQLFWGIEGKSRFVLDGKSQVLTPRSVFLYFPEDIHHICAETKWEYRWMTIDGPLCRETVEALGLSRGIQAGGDCPEDLFIHLTGKLYDVSPSGQRANAADAFRILTLACGAPSDSRNDSPPWLLTALDMMHRNYADSSLNINRIAEELGVHRTTLSRTFLKAKGISPIHYFQSYRVQKALSYLKETRFTVAEIANLCGFANVDYFTKVVRRATGCSPREFRNR